jgi:hypothetical protein
MFVALGQILSSPAAVRAFTVVFPRRTASVLGFATATRKTATNNRLHSTLLAEPVMENMTDSTVSPQKEYPIEMTEDERYLFDLNGFLIVRGVLTAEEIQEANHVIDQHAHEMVERKELALRNAKSGTPFFGEGPGRMDLGRCLEWGEESRVFKSILAHPRLVPLFHGILGKGYRMDHLPMILAQNKGSEG